MNKTEFLLELEIRHSQAKVSRNEAISKLSKEYWQGQVDAYYLAIVSARDLKRV